MEFSKFRNIFELSFQLAKTNFKLRNEGSYLGIFWYLLDPLLLFLLLIFLNKAVNFETDASYPIYLLIGLIAFNFFRQATMQSVNAIDGNADFIKSMRISKEVFVMSKVLESVFSHFFEILLLIFFLFYYNVSLIGLIFYPIVFVFFLFFVLGLSFMLATLGVFVHDLNNIWNVLTRLLWFATPIFYIVEKNSTIFFINLFNPVFYFIDITREIIYNKIPEFWMIITIILFSLFVLVLGFFVFQNYKNKFAEWV